jgi:DNA-binding protein HU-beta
MIKEDLIDAIIKETEFSRTDTKKFLEAYIKTVSDTLAKGDNIQLIGFLTLSVIERAARKGRNPKTGKEISIPSSKVVKLVTGKQLKEAVNNNKSSLPKAKKKK